MLRALAEIALKSKITKENLHRKKQFMAWEGVKTIALILSNLDSINKSAMDKFIDGTQKLVTVFYVEPGAKAAAYSDWQGYVKKDRNLLGLANGKAIHELKNKNFDLVINTSAENDLFSSDLTATLQSPFKTGGNNKFGELDLIIKKSDPHHVIDYLNEIIKYLKMIRN